MGKNFKAGDAYAYALLKVLYNETDKEKSFKGLVSDILDFVMVLKTCPTIEEFLANPTYSVKQKKDFLKEFFGNSLNIVIMNFLNVLCDSKRIINISLITNLFLELLLKNTNSHLVEIQTPLIKDYKLDIKKLNQILSTWFNKNQSNNNNNLIKFECFNSPLVIFSVKEVPELLGGFRLNFITDSKVIDFSISGKIKRLSTVLEY